MEFTHPVLVAMMFIVILTIGIGNILVGLAAIATNRAKVTLHWVALSWPVLLFFAHLDLFWHTLSLLDVKQISFGGFVFVITGPILLFLATSVLIGQPEQVISKGLLEHYLSMSRDFFVLLVLVEVWLVGIDVFVLGTGVGSATIWNLVCLALFASLAASKSLSLHKLGTVVAWLVFLTQAVARGAGVIP